MKYQFNSHYGQFAYRLTMTVPDGTPEVVCDEASANISYRCCGSAVDKALGVKTKDNPRFGSRSEVEYSEEDAERINAAVSAAITKWEDGDANKKALQLSFAVIGRYEYGQKETGKTANALATLLTDEMVELFRVQFNMPKASKDEIAKAAVSKLRTKK